ncbi:TPA: hypothetical protein ACTUT5_001005 [Legionella anisa]|nr:hypothetical protein [Legionella anisa]
MRELLKVLPEINRNEGETFLKELFSSVARVVNNPEIEFFLGLVEKSFLKFENKKPGSVSLTEFSRHILGLTLLYIKSSNERAIWNVDFIPTLGKIEQFLDVGQGELMIKFLNRIEIETLVSLNHSLNIDFDHLRSILNKCATSELIENGLLGIENGTASIAQFFIDNYASELNKNDSSAGFKLLVQDAMTLVERQKDQILPSISFAKSHRLSIFQSITESSDESVATYNSSLPIR